MRHCLCWQSLYLPFISASLILLVGRVSGRRSLLIAKAHAICKIHSKVAEWGLRHPLLIHIFCLLCVRFCVLCGSHTFMICCWQPSETLVFAAHKPTEGRE